VRPIHVAAGAVLAAVPSTALALGPTSSAASPAASIESLTLAHAHLGYGDKLAVTGAAGPNASGEGVALQLQNGATHGWRTVGHTTVGSTGRFRLGALLRRSGQVRVIGLPGAQAAGATAPVPAPISPSSPRAVTVAAALRASSHQRFALAGHRVTVAGRLLPGVAGRRIALQERRGRGWATIAGARTGDRGGFRLHVVPAAAGREALRLRFSGDRANTAALKRVGDLVAYRAALASWYEDAGSTACGFHAYYGVANLSLPCGTKVTFRSGSRSVTATVDDRGPYVGGREYDLNQNTAGALGFGGVGTVWASA
jgi:hypothetical protein